MLSCPNCDGVVNAIGCQACGWKIGDPHTRNEEANPRKPGKQYAFARAADAPPSPLHPGDWMVRAAVGNHPEAVQRLEGKGVADAPLALSGLPEGIYRLEGGRLVLIHEETTGTQLKAQQEYPATSQPNADPPTPILDAARREDKESDALAAMPTSHSKPQ